MSNEKIPRIIHYCWFGQNPKSEIIEKCIASWRKYCPDWEIKEWNEDNFDIAAVPYMEEAYEAKKWAFVSDVARLMVINQFGGIYLDTDVELLYKEPFDNYLSYDNILVFENARGINTGMIFGGVKKSKLSKELLNPYLEIHYSKETELVNSKMNYPIFKQEFPTLKWNGKTQIVSNTIIIGCEEYARLMKHYGTRTWCENLPEYHISKPGPVKKILRNPNIFEKLENNNILRKFLPFYTFLVYDLLDLGPIYFIKLQLLKTRKK